MTCTHGKNPKNKKCYSKAQADKIKLRISKNVAARKVTAALKRNVAAKRSRKSSAKRSKRSCTHGRHPKSGRCYSKKQADSIRRKLARKSAVRDAEARKSAARKVADALKRNVAAKRSRKTSAKRSRKAKRSKRSGLSAYNMFMKSEIGKVKRANPALSHKEAFSEAARNWSFQKQPKIARTNR